MKKTCTKDRRHMNGLHPQRDVNELNWLGIWRIHQWASPSVIRGPGTEPLVGESGGDEAPLKLKHFLLLNVQWKPQI